MGHVWQGFSESQMRDWMEQTGFVDVRVFALDVDEKAKGPALFVAVGFKRPQVGRETGGAVSVNT
jgi:hypothetical protein